MFTKAPAADGLVFHGFAYRKGIKCEGSNSLESFIGLVSKKNPFKYD